MEIWYPLLKYLFCNLGKHVLKYLKYLYEFLRLLLHVEQKHYHEDVLFDQNNNILANVNLSNLQLSVSGLA